MSSGGWHAVNSASGSHGDSAAAAAAAAAEEEASAGGYNPEGFDHFLAEEDALPGNESKWKDAMIFLIDCSEPMQFPMDAESIAEMSDAGRIKVKPESRDADSWDSAGGGGGSASADVSGSAAAAAASGGSAASGARGGGGGGAGAGGAVPSQLQMVLSVVLHSIRNKIVCSPDDYVGVCFFGSRATRNDNKFPHIYVHTPLQQLTAAAIRKLDQLRDEDEFEASIGGLPEADVQRGKVEMDKILWICSTMFQDAQVANCHKRILLLTNNDTPFNTHDALSRVRAVQKGKDLRELDIQTELIAVGKKPDATGRAKPFNPLLFFKDILLFDESDSLDNLHETMRSRFSDLQAQMFKKGMKKRALGSIKLQLGLGVDIGIKLYCTLRETRKESAVFLDRETNEKLETQTRWLDTATGSVLKPHDMRRYYPYGGVRVHFSDEEMKRIKDIGEPGLVLMGFKPFTALRVHHNVKNPYFIYPDDTAVTDSARAFKALLMAMTSMRQIAICRLIYRKGTVPRFVALVPQVAKVDPDGGEVIQPPGFNMIFLPYADDVRNLKFDPTPIATDELIVDAKKIVEKLTVKSLPMINNPALQHHYRVIQAIALQEEEPAPVEDDLQPDEEGMAKYSSLISKFASDAHELGSAAQAEIEPLVRKRKAAGADGDDSSKRVKKEDPEYDSIDWKQQLENDTLRKLTIPALKVYCRQHKLPLAGTKEVLLERVTGHLLAA